MISMVRGGPIRCARTAGELAVLVGLLWSGLCGAQIENPSFETTYEGWPSSRLLPSFWYRVDDPSFNSFCDESWYTDGAKSACLFSLPGRSFQAGQYQSFYQYVDLSGMDVLVFDAMLTGDPSGRFAHFEASVLVDEVPLWSAVVEGVYLAQEIDLSGLPDDVYGEPGWHMIELRLTALEDGTFNESYLAYWDNMMLLTGPRTIEANIVLDPDTLCPFFRGRWIACYIELPAGYDVAKIDESTVTLEEISAVTGVERWARCWSRWWWGRPWGRRWTCANVNRRTIVDRDRDGLPERVVRFDWAAVEAIAKAPQTTVAVAGRLFDGTPFEGTATLRVIEKPHRWK